MAPPQNDPMMSGTSIQLFRLLEHQNLSIISEDIGRARMVQQFRRSQRIGAVGGGVGSDLSTVFLEDRITTQYSSVVHYCTT